MTKLEKALAEAAATALRGALQTTKEVQKKTPTAYLLYSKSVRPSVAAEGIVGLPATAKRIGEMWKALSETEKTKFETEATIMKKEAEGQTTTVKAVKGNLKEADLKQVRRPDAPRVDDQPRLENPALHPSRRCQRW